MIKKLLLKLWIFLSLITTITNSKAQDIQQICIMADSAVLQDNWNLALSFYYRTFYFGKNETQHHAALGIIDSYVHLNQINEAQIFIDNYLENLKNPDQYRDILVKKIMLLLLQHKFEYASFLVQQKQYSTLFVDTISWFALKGIVLFLNDENENSLYYCKKACINQYQKQLQLDSLFLVFNKIQKKYAAKRAGRMSTIIAGLGQLYIGKPTDAINSFLLNYSFAALTAYVALHYGTPQAMLSFFPWNMRYYTGGIGKARQLASDKYNIEKGKLFYKLLKILEVPVC